MYRRKFYVVTRNGRRIEPENYAFKEVASRRASALYEVLRHFGDPDAQRIEVICTDRPYRIR